MAAIGKLKSELTLGALGDGGAQASGLRMILNGLDTIVALRSALRPVLQEALRTRSKRSRYVSGKVKRTKFRIFIYDEPILNGSVLSAAGLFRNATGAAHFLSEKCGNDVGEYVRVAQTIERARKAMLKLAEEQTRWL